MSFKIHTIRDNEGAFTPRKVLGRGIGSGKGKTSGRGGKGQTARSGVSLNGFEGGQMPIYRRLPKRGFKSRAVRPYELHFKKVAAWAAKGLVTEGQTIDANFLMANHLMPKTARGVSLIATGDLAMKLNFTVSRVSKKAKELVEKAGGSVTVE